jgi:cell wall-associated NlpC family hydrolase
MTDHEATARDAIVREAESWLDTPFHHEARVKGAGVDCGQMLVAVYSAVGIMPANYVVGQYPPDFASHRDTEWYLSIVRSFAVRELPPDEAPGPGDAVLWKWGRLYSHGAIVTRWPTIIHAWAPVAAVVRFNAENYPLGGRARLAFSAFPR